jgi:hypothetical protein
MQTRITSIGKRIPLIDDGHFAHHEALFSKMPVDRIEDLAGQILRFEQVAKLQKRCSIRRRFVAQIDTDKSTNCLAVIDRVFDSFVRLTETLLGDSIRRSRPRCSIRLRRCAATGNGLTAILAWTASPSTRSTGAGTYATDPMSRIAVWTAAKPTGCRDRGSAVHPTIYQCAGGTIGPPRATARMKPGCCCRRARYAAMVG